MKTGRSDTILARSSRLDYHARAGGYEAIPGSKGSEIVSVGNGIADRTSTQAGFWGSLTAYFDRDKIDATAVNRDKIEAAKYYTTDQRKFGALVLHGIVECDRGYLPSKHEVDDYLRIPAALNSPDLRVVDGPADSQYSFEYLRYDFPGSSAHVRTRLTTNPPRIHAYVYDAVEARDLKFGRKPLTPANVSVIKGYLDFIAYVVDNRKAQRYTAAGYPNRGVLYIDHQSRHPAAC